MKSKVKKNRRRILLLLIVFSLFCSFLLYSLNLSIKQVNDKLKEKEKLTLEYSKLIDEEDTLNKEVIKLQDPEYIARYVREKYMYSKDGELILRISE